MAIAESQGEGKSSIRADTATTKITATTQGARDEKGEYITDISKGKVRSRLTFLIYLTEGFNGGATTFYTATQHEPGVLSARGVVPQRGAVLCFPHGEAEESPVHEGSAVDASLGGEKYKYVIRTDVLFAIDK